MMSETTETQNVSTKLVDEEVTAALDSCDVSADFDGSVTIGFGDDAYTTATVTFDPQTYVSDVASVRRELPMYFDEELKFKGGETLVLKVKIE